MSCGARKGKSMGGPSRESLEPFADGALETRCTSGAGLGCDSYGLVFRSQKSLKALFKAEKIS